ncbi:aminotransferase class IV [Moheibacter sediminis]|uniref:Branched-chain amino acid aminotransferase n=1 Tax=Moheibacter sediminis TaxID=1434700 RepID=A0A1W2C3E1_9FLAO|nr:aminotransferase class IV [Moheibacter sediminis]SMC79693.1 branched-chain amino acid aminotransferase [Moheibacter sediminis]
MKFNLNGNLLEYADSIFKIDNRAFLHGDFITEFVRAADGKILLWEEHYFNLMASLRIFRMKIPMDFTPEFLENEILRTISENEIQNAKIEIIIFRNSNSEDLLTQSGISYLIKVNTIFEDSNYIWKNLPSEIEIFKDYSVNPTFFTQIRSHKPEEIVALAYMQENEYNDLVLLNPDKKIARTVLGNPFLIQGNQIKTPKISEGGIRSVLRNHLCKLLDKSEEFEFEETDIFPFELQKTNELFICMEGEGILSIHQNRKKEYTTEMTGKVLELMNSVVVTN